MSEPEFFKMSKHGTIFDMHKKIDSFTAENKRLREENELKDRVVEACRRVVRPMQRQSKENAPLEYELFESLQALDSALNSGPGEREDGKG